MKVIRLTFCTWLAAAAAGFGHDLAGRPHLHTSDAVLPFAVVGLVLLLSVRARRACPVARRS